MTHSVSLTITLMPAYFPCPYLGAEVELTDEREAYVTRKHGDLVPLYSRLAETLAAPQRVSRSPRSADTRLFSRWYDDLRGGKHAVLVVVKDIEVERHWIVTAYVARKPPGGALEWETS
jgi:hypothetical protein